ncbi:MAG: TonB-dependent receptor [Candidatus Kapabacteria bacterium]|nr:TonB-dependent receptor [Candidatus Kapabacteria bacterium]
MRLTWLFILALLASSTINLTAQSTGTITGSVKNSATQEALVGATVRIEGTKLGGFTNTKGEFTIKNIPPKSYTIVVSSVGYKTKSLFNTVITSGNVVSLTVELEPTFTESKEIVVEATTFGKRSETPLSVQSLTTEEIRSNPGGNFDISRAIQALPGVGGATGGAGFRNDITIRGGGPSENVYYLDGIEIPQINHFATQGSAGGPAGILNVAFIEDVNLSSSSFGSGYDNALSSVIAVKQKNGNNERLQGNIRVSGTETALTFDGPLSDNTTFIASARRSYLDLLFQALDLPIRPNYWDFQFKTTTKLDEKTTLSVLGVGAIDDFRFAAPKQSTPEKEYAFRTAPIVNQWNYTIGASLRRAIGNGQLFVSLSRNMFDNTLDKFADGKNDDESARVFKLTSWEIENKFRAEYSLITSELKFKTGVQGQLVRYTNTTFNKFSPVLPAVQFESDLRFGRYGAYADMASSALNNRLQFTAGVRFDGNTFTTTGNEFWRTLSPRASMTFVVDSAWSINATAGRYFKMPQYTILGYRDSTNALVNQGVAYIGTNHAVIGVEYVPDPSIRITAEAFYKTYDNYPVSNVDGVSLANKGITFGAIGNEPVTSDGKGRAYGMELFFQKKLTENWFTTVSYTLLFSEFTSRFSPDVYVPSAWDFRHLVSGIVGYKLGDGWELGGKFRFAGGSPYTPYDTAQSRLQYLTTGNGVFDNTRLNSLRLGPFRQLDIRVDKKWSFQSWSLDIFIDVQNLLGATQPAVPGYTFTRTEDNAGWASTDGQPVRIDGANATPVLIENGSRLVQPTLGIIIEF